MSILLIESIEDLKRESYRDNGDFVEFFVLLAGGLAKSSKRISYRPASNEFLVINEIDESYQEVFMKDLNIHTNLVEAISKRSLYRR